MAKKRKRRSVVPVIIVMLLIMATVVGGGIFLYINANKLMLPGTWIREIDITKQAVYEAEKYIEGAAFGDEVDVESYISNIKLTSILQVSKEGELSETLSKEDYDKALEQCQTGLENAIRDLIARRIKESDIETDMSVDDLVSETLGMNLKDYLNTYGPQMMPDFEEVNNLYGKRAYYEATKDSMTIKTSDEDVTNCNYAVSHGMLVIDYSDGAAIYYER